MKKINILFLIMTALIAGVSCNNEWEDEQFMHLVSFKAPLDDQGVTKVYVRYKPDGIVDYNLPVLVSGSTLYDKDLTVGVVIDPDTLKVINEERFSIRTELFYKELESSYFSMPSTATISAGTNKGLLPITFSLKDLNLTDKWILPLSIADATDGSYEVNMRKNYRKAMLRITPFNDYSGEYSATTCRIYFKGNETDGFVAEYKTAYVVDENTVFIYAGLVDEDRQDRKHYKIFIQFNEDEDQTLTLYTDNPDMNLDVIGTPTYSITERMDDTLPYLKLRDIVMDIEYEFTDYTSVEGLPIHYHAEGTLALQRKINIQAPDEDQAIEWN